MYAYANEAKDADYGRPDSHWSPANPDRDPASIRLEPRRPDTFRYVFRWAEWDPASPINREAVDRDAKEAGRDLLQRKPRDPAVNPSCAYLISGC